MKKSFIEEKILEKAKERFQKEYFGALKMLRDNPVLKRLKIGEFFLCAEGGYCPATDLMRNGGLAVDSLLRRETNINKLESDLIEQYRQEESDELFNKLSSVEYLFQEREG